MKFRSVPLLVARLRDYPWTTPGPLSRRDAGVLALAAAFFMLVIYHPLLLTGNYYWGSGTDMLTLQFPVRHFAHSWMRAGIFPLWNPYIFDGLPFHTGPHPLFYPMMWLGTLVSTHTALWLEILFHAWLGVFAFSCLARFLRCSPVGSLLAGLSFGLGGFFVGHLYAGHMDLIEAYSYLPLVFLLQLGAVRWRGFGWTLLAGLGLAWVGLIGNYEALHWMVLLWLYPLWTAAVGRNRPVGSWLWRQPFSRETMPPRAEGDAELARGVPYAGRGRDALWVLLRLGAGLLAAAAFLAVQWLPQLESSRYLSLPFYNPTEPGAPFLNWFTLAVPHVFERTYAAYGFTRWSNWEGQAYLGLAGLVAAGYALTGPRTRWLGPAVPALLCFLLASGQPFYGLLVRLDPAASFFEVPTRWIGPFSFFMALLQAQGYDRMLRGRPFPGLQKAAAGLWLVFLALWGFLFYSSPQSGWWKALLKSITSPTEWLYILIGSQPEALDSLLVVTALRVAWTALVLFYLMLALGKLQKGRWAWLVVLVAVDLLVFAYPYMQRTEESTFLIGAEQAAFLQTNLGPQRWTGDAGVAQMNMGMARGLSSVGGYDVVGSHAYDSAARQIYHLPDDGVRFCRLEEVDPGPFWQVQGLRWYLTSHNEIGGEDQLQDYGQFSPGLRALADPHVFGRAFVVPQAEVSVDKSVFELIARDAEAFRRSVFLQAPPPEDRSGPGGSVQGVWLEPNRVRVEATGPGYLVLTDLYAPGWRATVDGVPTPVLRANGGLHRAVGLSPGPHRVVFTYFPDTLRQGAWISGISLTLWLGLLLLGRSRPAPPAPERRPKKKKR